MNHGCLRIKKLAVSAIPFFLIASWTMAEDKGKAAPASNDPSNWNVSAMIHQAADRVASRYNCNEEQTKLTHQMMEAGVNRFLRENQDEIWPLLREMWQYQSNGGTPDPETAKRLSKRLLPLVDKAKEAIYSANSEWCKSLTPEQKALYDFDRKEMEGTFDQMVGNFKKWEQGEVVPQPIFPPPKKNPAEPKKPPKPQGKVIPAAAVKETLHTDKDALRLGLRAYVEKFIKDYELDATQTEAANSILREMEARSDAHLDAVKTELDAVVAQKDQARKNAEWGKLPDFDKTIEKINAPVAAMFDELKNRLETIPTEGQRQKYRDKLAAGAGKMDKADGASAADAASKPAKSSKKTPTTKPAVPKTPSEAKTKPKPTEETSTPPK